MAKRSTRFLPLLAALGLAASLAGTGHAAEPAANNTAGAAAAPFAAPPVLAGTPDVATLVAKVTPAVVNITTIHDVRAPQMGEFPFSLGPFSGLFPEQRRRGGDSVLHQTALGSGFLVDSAGHVVTNAHVVEEADSVKVKLSDDREFEAKVKGRDTRLDLAVLELVGARDLPAVSLGSSERVRVGEYVVAIGNPFGLGNTVTMGIVSAKSRAIGAGPYDDFIQTDASINPGNSGGPLFDLRGQVVGINTAINPNGRGIGFAIPVDALKDVLPQLLSTGKVARGRLGVAIQPVDPQLAKALGLARPEGALVADVEGGGPADKAGLKAGDLILKVDQSAVTRAEDLPRIVARHAPGTKVKVEFRREHANRTLEVNLDEVHDESNPQAAANQPGAAPNANSPKGVGVQLTDVPGRGVVVGRVIAGSPAEGELEPGDVIVEVNRTPVTRATEVVQRIGAVPAGTPILFKVTRQNKTRFVAIERR
ncbi:MAG: Do family serine endopeptidase [Polyangiaceae bacterium]